MLLPSNPLEQALFNSASDSSKAPEFYDLLMESNVFILGTVTGKEENEGSFNINEDQEFDIQHWEKDDDSSPVIPFFTSLQTLQQAIEEDSPYIEISTASFFEMTLGVSLVLNPNTDYGLEFNADDVSLLLDNALLNEEDLESGEINLGVLESFPPQLSMGMSTVFSSYPQIETAYMAYIHVPSEDKDPHLLVGLQGGEGLEDIIEKIAEEISSEDNDSGFEMFDFYVMTENDPEGISQFILEENNPFYRAASNKVH